MCTVQGKMVGSYEMDVTIVKLLMVPKGYVIVMIMFVNCIKKPNQLSILVYLTLIITTPN